MLRFHELQVSRELKSKKRRPKAAASFASNL